MFSAAEPFELKQRLPISVLFEKHVPYDATDPGSLRG